MMDKLRVFSTFNTSSGGFKGPKKIKKKDLPLGPNGMIIRNLEDKPSVSRSEILEKLEKNSAPKKSQKVKGQKFGIGFLGEGDEKPLEANSDIQKNDPSNPMTTEKLKTMLNSGAVNFSGKEQEVLKKILGN